MAGGLGLIQSYQTYTEVAKPNASQRTDQSSAEGTCTVRRSKSTYTALTPTARRVWPRMLTEGHATEVGSAAYDPAAMRKSPKNCGGEQSIGSGRWQNMIWGQPRTPRGKAHLDSLRSGRNVDDEARGTA